MKKIFLTMSVAFAVLVISAQGAATTTTTTKTTDSKATTTKTAAKPVAKPAAKPAAKSTTTKTTDTKTTTNDENNQAEESDSLHPRRSSRILVLCFLNKARFLTGLYFCACLMAFIQCLAPLQQCIFYSQCRFNRSFIKTPP